MLPQPLVMLASAGRRNQMFESTFPVGTGSSTNACRQSRNAYFLGSAPPMSEEYILPPTRLAQRVIGTFVMIVNIMQMVAIYAGCRESYDLAWIWSLLIAISLGFQSRLGPFVGTWGAHFGWGWGWLPSIIVCLGLGFSAYYLDSFVDYRKRRHQQQIDDDVKDEMNRRKKAEVTPWTEGESGEA